MVKNIFKSLFWFVLYFVTQTIGMIGLFFYDLFAGNLVFSNMENADVVYEELMAYLFSIALPSLFIGAILYFIVFVLYKLIRKHPFDFKTIDYDKFLYCLGIGLILNVVISLIINLIALALPESVVNALNESTSMALEGFPLWFTLLATGICVPILEELVFRYGMCGILARKNATVGIIVSAVIFGLVHGNPLQIGYATVLGLIFGYVYLKHGNIWYTIMLHAAINSSSTLVAHFGAAWLYIVFALFGIVNCVLLYKKNPEIKNFFKKNVYIEDNEA